MTAPDIEPSQDALGRIATSVSTRIDRARRRARLALGAATGIAAVLTIAGVGIALQPATSQVECYASAESSSLSSRGDLQLGAGSPIERALAQCASITATDASTESDSDAPATSSTEAGASTLSQPEAEYLVCRHDSDYGVLTLDPAARLDPVAACAAIGMEPAG